MAIRFDAASDRISLTATVPDPSAGFTLLGWAYVEVNTSTNATFARLHANSGASTTVTVATDNAAPAGPGYFTAGGSIVSSTQAPVGEWRHVAVTCTGTSGIIYVAVPAGVTDVDSGSVAGAASPTGITLGGRSPSDATEFLNGRLAYWRLWSTVLTQAQVEAERTSAVPVITGNLWADWPLATASDLTDHSGNGRDFSAGTTAVTTATGPPIAADVAGTVAADLGAVAATVVGTRVVGGTVVGNLGSLDGTVAGTRTVVGGVPATLGRVDVTALGLRAVTGTATADLGTLHVVATVAGSLPSTRLRASGREPATHAAGREPRESI